MLPPAHLGAWDFRTSPLEPTRRLHGSAVPWNSMCGRMASWRSASELSALFGAELAVAEPLAPSYNVLPPLRSTPSPALGAADGSAP
jgi:hypothetical protein